MSITVSNYAQEIKVNPSNTETTNDSTEVFVFVEVPPSYPGGDEARLIFLRDEIMYPEDAKEKGIQGTIYASFVVEKDGSISNINIMRRIGGGCDEEVIRIIKKMPK